MGCVIEVGVVVTGCGDVLGWVFVRRCGWVSE